MSAKTVTDTSSDSPAAVVRCDWVTADPLYVDYHDHQWGVPLHDERALFEMLILEGMQAGLSWWIILKKREHFRRAMDHFDATKIAKYSDKKLESLLANSNIIRHRLKLKAAIGNARCYLALRAQGLTLDKMVWDLVGGEPIDNPWLSPAQVPQTTELSDRLSQQLKKHGFKYVGSTICYAYLQAIGVVNDHIRDCVCRQR